MLRFKQFLSESIFTPIVGKCNLTEAFKRVTMRDIFTPRSDNTQPLSIEVFHSGQHDLTKSDPVRSVLLQPKPPRRQNRIIAAQNFRRSEVDGMRAIPTQNQPSSSYIGLYTTPDAESASRYRARGESFEDATKRINAKLTSLDIEIDPKEMLVFDTFDNFEDELRNIINQRSKIDPKKDSKIHWPDVMATGAARHFREKGIKGIGIKTGGGESPTQLSGEFVILDPSIIKSKRDVTSEFIKSKKPPETTVPKIETAPDTSVLNKQKEPNTKIPKIKNNFNKNILPNNFKPIFSSDPNSTSNFAYDVAGAMGDVTTRDQTMKKAAASLYNPMYSDSEQMMGDAFLRGGGEDYAVDPTFLQMANQRKKDRQK